MTRPPAAASPRVLLGLVSTLFLLSGFSALLLQTVWQRLLGFFSGVDVHSVTVVVAAFMGGLGLGSLAGGWLADRLGPRGRLVVFCLAELAVGGFALGSVHFYYDVLYGRYFHLSASPVALVAVLFGSLLVPTFCMGVTLPILARSFTARVEAAPSVVGVLYGVNTLGAAAGAFVTGWVLLRHLDFPGVLRVGAALNGVSALGALALLAFPARDAAAAAMNRETGSAASDRSPGATGWSAGTWMVIYALSGFIALGLEILWFRLLSVLQKPTAFTFGNLLGIYLTGLALGVFAGIGWAARTRRPGRWFLALQAGVTAYVALSLAWLLDALPRAAWLAPVWDHLAHSEPADIAAVLRLGVNAPPADPAATSLFGLLYFGLPLLLIGPPTLLMGASFPLLQRAVQTDAARLGRRVGALQTMNILGSLLGAVGVGAVGLSLFGTAGTLRVLVLLGGAFGWLLLREGGAGRAAHVLGAAVLAGLLWLTPNGATLWARFHGTTDPATIIAAEDGSGLSLLMARKNAFRDGADVFANGLSQSWIPYASIHSQLGAMPVLLHPAPRDVAVIGLASGDTAYSLGGRPETDSVTCIEIVRPQHLTLKELNDRMDYGALHYLLSSPRYRLRFTDGRAYLRRTARRFDVIEADALRPNSAYSGNLYSLEYFELLKSKLRPGGIAVTWAPTDRVLRTFLRAFPHVLLVDGLVFGSATPIVVDREALAARLRDPFTVAHYARSGVPYASFFDHLLNGQCRVFTPEDARAPLADLNRDLAPRDEYLVPAPVP